MYYTDGIPIAILVFLLGFWGILIIVSLASYVLRGLAILNMSKARGLSNGWLGFVPFLYLYQFGTLAGEIEVGNKKIKNTGLWLLVLPMVSSVVITISYMLLFIPMLIMTARMEIDPNADWGYLFLLLIIGILVFVVAIVIVQLAINLLRGLVLHKIFSHYHAGQKPVFYMLVCLFLVMAEPILLYAHSKKPLLCYEKSQDETIFSNAISS